MNQTKKRASDVFLEISEEYRKKSRKEQRAIAKANREGQTSPEFIDDYIFRLEHDFIYDGIIFWNGCRISQEWEEYKEKVGYYERHPERKEEGQAFTSNIIEWWIEKYQELCCHE